MESPEMIRIRLRDDLEAVRHERGEIVLDINDSGNWVRGFEIVGGFVPFSVAKAVSPFKPIPPAPPSIPLPGTVTYDPEADAAFVYFEYAPNLVRLTPTELAGLKVVSHSVNPTAIYGLDGSGGLVWIRIPIADLASAERFLRLLAGGRPFHTG
jgi:uncharacterized protein YuzE